MKKRLLSAFLTLAMVLTLLPSAALAAPNDTEFHINGIQAMKALVAEKLDVDVNDVTIHSVDVHGAKKNAPNQGDPAVATGGTLYNKYTNVGDLGAQGSNGRLTGYDDIWMVLNTVNVIDEESVDAITIYAKTGTWYLWPFGQVGGEELAPVTVYLSEGAIKSEQLYEKLITSIDVTSGSLTPPVETTYSYTVNYYWVDEKGTVTKSDTVDSVTADAVSNEQITYKTPENVQGCDSSNTYVLDTEKSSKDFIWDTDKQIFDVYYAVNNNGNETPDYQEETYTLSYNPNGAAGTITDSNQYYAGNQVGLAAGNTLGAEGDGIVFLGWTQGENGYTASTPAEQAPTDGTLLNGYVTFTDADITVYAAWAKDVNNNDKPDYEESPVELDWPIQISFCDPDMTAIGNTQTVEKSGAATPPTSNGDKKITGWTLDTAGQTAYNSKTFTYSELAKLVDEADGWNEYYKEGYLTLYAVYAEEPSELGWPIQISFCDPDMTAIGNTQTVEKSGAATPPTSNGDKKITGWTLDTAGQTAYDSKTFTYSELAKLVDETDGWNEYYEEGYLTLYAVYAEDPEPAQRTAIVTFQINASDDHGIYAPNNETLKYTWDDMSAMIDTPEVICDEGYEVVAWVAEGDGTHRVNLSKAEIDPEWAYFADGETTGYLTVYPVFEAVEAPQRTAIVTFSINASDDHGIYDSGRDVVTYTWTDMTATITPPTVVCDEGYELVGWVLSGATTTTLTTPDIEVDPNLAYFADGETTGYLTVYPVFKAVEAPQRTAIVTFSINASDDHGIYDSGRDVVTYTWTDMTAMITPPTVACDEGYELVGWVLNGATTTTLTTPDIEVDPNLAYFAEGEDTGYLTVYPVFKAVEAPQRTAIVTFSINASDDHGIYDSGRDVVTYTWTDMTAMITPPTVVCDEGYEHVGWVLNGATTTELTVPNIQVDPNLAYFAEGEDTGYLTVYPVFKTVEAEAKTVGLNYWDVVNDKQVAEGSVTVDTDATNVNTSTFTDIPEGYELVWTGDLPIVDGWVWVEVRPVEGTKTVGLNYWDIANDKQVAEGSVTVDADATNVNTSTFTDIPEGYELVWTGDLPIVDGWVWVEVRPVDAETKTVGLNYWDVVNNKQVAEGSVTVAADATIVNTSTFTDIPAGYELVWVGDLQINDGWVWVEVRPVDAETKTVGLNYWDIVNNKQVAEGSVTVDADATNVNTSTFTDIPEGYELVWTGDLPIVDGWVWVEVRPVEGTKTVGLNYWDIVNDKQVAEGSVTVDADATNVNTSTFTDIPEGYELVWTGDLPIVDGWVWVEVRPVGDTPVEKLLLTYDANYGSNPETKVIGYEAGETAIIKGDLFGRKNYTFTGWNTDPDGDGKSYDQGDKLEMDENITLYAQWKRVDNDDDNDRPSTGTRYTIDASASRGGDISPSGRVFVARGNDRTFRITADEGYVIDDVRVDGESVGAVRTYTFENVRRDHTIEVIFVPDGQQTVVYGPDDTGVSDWLNVDDHVSYLNGYPGGLFGPNDNMTRAEVAQMFYNLLLNQNVAVTVSFSDVAADAWYAPAVNALASLGIVQGVGDGQFAPERTITRAEFTVIAMRFAELPVGGTNPFSDVRTSDWFYAQVVGAAQYGWITGYTNGTFGPNNTITRAEVTAIVNRMLSRSADEDFVDDNVADLVQFSDVALTYWAYYDIMEATNFHEYEWDNGVEAWTDLA